MGRKKRPFYRLVVLDSRKRRDGAYLANLGFYNPFTEPHEVELHADEIIAWLSKGATVSETARSLLRSEGVLYKYSLVKQGLDDRRDRDPHERVAGQRRGQRCRSASDAKAAKAAEAEAEAKAAAEAEAKAEAEAEAAEKAAAAAEAKAKAEAEAAEKAAEAAEGRRGSRRRRLPKRPPAEEAAPRKPAKPPRKPPKTQRRRKRTSERPGRIHRRRAKTREGDQSRRSTEAIEEQDDVLNIGQERVLELISYLVVNLVEHPDDVTRGYRPAAGPGRLPGAGQRRRIWARSSARADRPPGPCGCC